MAKRKSTRLPPLTPRAQEVVRHVVNTVALGTHDNEGDVDSIAASLKMSAARLRTLLAKLTEQGYVTLQSDFVYPTVVALQWQNPDLDAKAAAKVLKALK